LLLRHPKAEQKIGCGIDLFKVDRDSQHPTKCFWIVRLDETATEFSTRKCIAEEAPLTQFSSACRTAIIDQILAFKKQNFDNRWSSVSCELTNTSVTYESCHVDHEPPFREIVDRFIREEGLDPASIEITAGGDGSTCDRFVDSEMTSRFAAFHLKNARLRIVAEKENLRRRRRKTEPLSLDFGPSSV
jgi:hypothetical protein